MKNPAGMRNFSLYGLAPHVLMLALGLASGFMIGRRPTALASTRHASNSAPQIDGNCDLLALETIEVLPGNGEERDLYVANRSVLDLEVDEDSDSLGTPDVVVRQGRRFVEPSAPRRMTRRFQLDPGPCRVVVLNTGAQPMCTTLKAVATRAP
jgi:hypothetical protein